MKVRRGLYSDTVTLRRAGSGTHFFVLAFGCEWVSTSVSGPITSAAGCKHLSERGNSTGDMSESPSFLP